MRIYMEDAVRVYRTDFKRGFIDLLEMSGIRHYRCYSCLDAELCNKDWIFVIRGTSLNMDVLTGNITRFSDKGTVKRYYVEEEKGRPL